MELKRTILIVSSIVIPLMGVGVTVYSLSSNHREYVNSQKTEIKKEDQADFTKLNTAVSSSITAIDKLNDCARQEDMQQCAALKMPYTGKPCNNKPLSPAVYSKLNSGFYHGRQALVAQMRQGYRDIAFSLSGLGSRHSEFMPMFYKFQNLRHKHDLDPYYEYPSLLKLEIRADNLYRWINHT